MHMPRCGNAAFSMGASRRKPRYSLSCFPSSSPSCHGFMGTDMIEYAEPHGVTSFASRTYLLARFPSHRQHRIRSCFVPSRPDAATLRSSRYLREKSIICNP